MINKIPEHRTTFGHPITIDPNLPITLSKILGLIIALEFRSQFFRLIRAGRKKELSSHAHPIPTEMQIPYPTKGSRGDELIVKKAAMVVILVKKIGTKRASIPDAITLCTFFWNLSSLKNFVITCTPSELAIVSRMIGIEVFNKAKRNLSDPVILYAHPINPIIDTSEKTITIITIPTAGRLRRLINKIAIIMTRPAFTSN